MILQKSCHDMDILTWLLGKKCKAVSSFGSTRLFKPECAPEGAALRCLDGCKAKEKCLFDAEKIYITSPKTGLATGSSWMSSVLSVENTMESTYKALREGPYGRCVYHCDNDVVDHQQTNLLMEDGSTISFTMCAFTESCTGRGFPVHLFQYGSPDAAHQLEGVELIVLLPGAEFFKLREQP